MMYKQKSILLILFLFVLVKSIYAQELSVKSFYLVHSDLTAQTQPYKDLNGKNCALIKIQLIGEIAELEGNVILPLVKHINETWVYMPQNSRQLKIFTKNFLPVMVTFADFGIEKLESNRTYVLVLNQYEGETSVQKTIGTTNMFSTVSSNNSISTSGTTIAIPVTEGISIEMVKVEAGTFTMGDLMEQLGQRFWKPDLEIINVTLTKDYYIGKYEVTQSLWKSIMNSNPSSFKGDNLPVERVSWDDCQVFIDKLNQKTGKSFRLPTEAEWEYAAKGGCKSVSYKYSGSNRIKNVAWYEDNSKGKTHSVGCKQANELGIFDMSGNVYEWCQDWYNRDLSSQTNPTGPIEGKSRVCRGGSFDKGMAWCENSDRYLSTPDSKRSNLGFRLVLSE